MKTALLYVVGAAMLIGVGSWVVWCILTEELDPHAEGFL